MQRSVMPCVVTLEAPNPQDLTAMRGIDRTHLGWNEGPRTVEREAGPIQLFGAAVRRVYKG